MVKFVVYVNEDRLVCIIFYHRVISLLIINLKIMYVVILERKE